MSTLLVMLTVACLVQHVSWSGFNVHSSGDADTVACPVSGSELA